MSIEIKINRLLEENDEQTIQRYIKKERLDTVNNPNDTFPFLDRKDAKKSVKELLTLMLKRDNQKLTPEIERKFFKRFEPFYQDGIGDGSLLDKKTKKILRFTHEADLLGLIDGLPAEDWMTEVGIKIPEKKQGFIKRVFGKK